MQQERKPPRITFTQIAILAGLALTACVLFVVVAGLALQNGAGFFAPQDTPVPRNTATPYRSPTLAPTLTPTTVPYEMLIPEGWIQFQTELMEIWLPQEFQIAEAGLLEPTANTAVRELILTGSTADPSLYRMVALVSYEPLPGDSLEEHLDAQIASLPPVIRLTERRKVFVNSTEAVRFTFETRLNSLDFNILSYVFLDGGTIWYVEFGAQINEFYEMLPVFEQGVKTFRPKQ